MKSMERKTKRIFICMPMKDRSDIDIQNSIAKFSDVIRRKYSGPIEIIHNFTMEVPPSSVKNKSVWYLAKAIDKMANADYLAYVRGVGCEYRGCEIEKEIAETYGIKVMGFSTAKHICPDLFAKEETWGDRLRKYNVSTVNTSPSLASSVTIGEFNDGN